MFIRGSDVEPKPTLTQYHLLLTIKGPKSPHLERGAILVQLAQEGAVRKNKSNHSVWLPLFWALLRTHWLFGPTRENVAVHSRRFLDYSACRHAHHHFTDMLDLA